MASTTLTNCETEPIDVRVVEGEITAGFPEPLEVTATTPLPVSITGQPIVVTGSVSVTASTPLEITGQVTVDAYEQAIQVIPVCFLRNGLHTHGQQVILYDLTVTPAIEVSRTLVNLDGTVVTGTPTLEQCPVDRYEIQTIPVCYDHVDGTALGFKAITFDRADDTVSTIVYDTDGGVVIGAVELACDSFHLQRDRVCVQTGTAISTVFLVTLYTLLDGDTLPTIISRTVEELGGATGLATAYTIVDCPHLDIELIPVCVDNAGTIQSDFLRITYDVTDLEPVEVERVLLSGEAFAIVECPQDTVSVQRSCYIVGGLRYVGWQIFTHDLLNNTTETQLVDYDLTPVVLGVIVDCTVTVVTSPVCYHTGNPAVINRGFRTDFYHEDGEQYDSIMYSSTWVELIGATYIECPSTEWDIEPVCYRVDGGAIQHGFLQLLRNSLTNELIDTTLWNISFVDVPTYTLVPCPNTMYTVEQTDVCYVPIGSGVIPTISGLLVHVYEVTEETEGEMVLITRVLLDSAGVLVADGTYELRECTSLMPTLTAVCYSTDGNVTIQAGFAEVMYLVTNDEYVIDSSRLLSNSFTPVAGGTIVPCETQEVVALQAISAVSGAQFLAGGGNATANPVFPVRSVSWTTVMDDPLVLSGILVQLTMGSGNVITQHVGPNSSHTLNLDDSDDYVDSFTMTSLGAAMRVYWNMVS